MHGSKPTIKDIVLELQQPPEIIDLVCQENLQEEEEEQRDDYKVLLRCGYCGVQLRVFFRSSAFTIRQLHQLLLQDLDLICCRCGTIKLNHGRRQ